MATKTTYKVREMVEDPKEPLIFTIKGMVEYATLARTVGFEDHQDHFIMWEEFHLGDELVKRSAHVILKYPSVVADAVAGRF